MTKHSTRAISSGAIAAAVAVAAGVMLAPTSAMAADHLDAPGLTSPGGDGRLDINDVYVFEGKNRSNTVIAATVSPLATGDSTFAPRSVGAYHLRIDKNGDAVEDLTYTIDFSVPAADGSQTATVRTSVGADAPQAGPLGKPIGSGVTEKKFQLGPGQGGKAQAGLFSDPFFFDLAGFRGTVEGVGDRQLNDGRQSDFFDQLNTLAIVIEVPDRLLGTNIGVWATTSSEQGRTDVQIDRMGRPAINTVVNSSGPIVQADKNAKNVFNAGVPRNDVRDFTAATISALKAFSALDAEGAYADEQAAALAGVLLPDVITYDTRTVAMGPLNGRAPKDDVIDVELNILTGGDPLGLFDDRDEVGGVRTDSVGAHTDYRTSFPYLGVPH